MKNNRILIIILFIAVAVLYAIVLIDKPQKETQSSEIKIAYVNSDSLLENYSYYQSLKENLEKEHDRLSEQINSQAKSLENEVQKYQEEAENLTIAQRQAKEEQLYKKQQDLLKKREELLDELGDKERELQEQLHNDLIGYLKEFNQTTNYTLILGYSRGGGILLANDSLDITKAVIEGLNERKR